MKIASKFLIAAFFLSTFVGFAQDTITNKKGSKYVFQSLKHLDATPIENQNSTGTCWSFSALSYFESELMRMGKGDHRLSEMYVVRKAYEGKADYYVRMHGNHNFGAGGAFHDIPWVINHYGIVPLEVYKGLSYGTEEHNHDELDGILTAAVKVIKDNPQKKLTPAWKNAIGGVLDAYLGEDPTEFKYKGKKYTPRSYADELGLKMSDYVAITSYTHHPFYSSFVLEIPDNWAFGSVYNVPLDEMMNVMEQAVMKGYTFAWGADVSEDGFSFRDGLAILPKDPNTIKRKGKDSKYFNNAGAEKISNAFEEPVPQLWVTQEQRQEAFDNFETTDDHGMHVTGLVKDQNGDKYFLVKNSWGDDYNDCDGYFYASFAFVRYKTMNIYVHKDALSDDLKKKLGIK